MDELDIMRMFDIGFRVDIVHKRRVQTCGCRSERHIQSRKRRR